MSPIGWSLIEIAHGNLALIEPTMLSANLFLNRNRPKKPNNRICLLAKESQIGKEGRASGEVLSLRYVRDVLTLFQRFSRVIF